MTLDEVCAYLTQRGVEYEVREIEHGKQVKAKTQYGETASIYNRSGKVVIGGRRSPLRDALTSWKDSGFAPATASENADAGGAQRPPGVSKRVFIVYGHDEGALRDLELILRRMGLEPIVLAALPARGETIIEKLEQQLVQSQNVGFACVLLTPDDEGHRAGHPAEIRYRARQNVILELGMVLARLGRRKVAILYKESVEKPSDIAGLVYLGFKERIDEVKPILFKELKDAGYEPSPAGL